MIGAIREYSPHSTRLNSCISFSIYYIRNIYHQDITMLCGDMQQCSILIRAVNVQGNTGNTTLPVASLPLL